MQDIFKMMGNFIYSDKSVILKFRLFTLQAYHGALSPGQATGILLYCTVNEALGNSESNYFYRRI